jgi:hypothetical protein
MIMQPKTIAILYICSGKYDIFWDDFFASCERNFLPAWDKHYFVFSDHNDFLEGYDISRITYQHIPLEPWPFPTLNRYKYFNEVLPLLERFDYVYFFNSNLRFLEPIGEEILPAENQKFVFTQHPYTCDQTVNEFGYDRNPESNAYIPFGEGKYYVAGGLNGGKTVDFCFLIKTINEWTQEDVAKGVIAKWHDESYINRFYLSFDDAKILDPGYLYFEESGLNHYPKILVKNKTKHGGFAYLRNIDKSEMDEKHRKLSFKGRIKNFIKKLVS